MVHKLLHVREHHCALTVLCQLPQPPPILLLRTVEHVLEAASSPTIVLLQALRLLLQLQLRGALRSVVVRLEPHSLWYSAFTAWFTTFETLYAVCDAGPATPFDTLNVLVQRIEEPALANAFVAVLLRRLDLLLYTLFTSDHVYTVLTVLNVTVERVVRCAAAHVIHSLPRTQSFLPWVLDGDSLS
uniref:Uncharacterized protein n=1 Tax=Lygus hesperus TaxID=30085 RepID=A0A0A9XXM2_LYGHE